MSGAGSFGAGSSPAGAYTPSSSNATTVAALRALKLDAQARDFLLDENGRYVAAHPVDHRAMMLLIPRLTSIRSSQTQGARWDDLVISDEETMTARFTEIVREAWRELLDAGDIRIDRVAARPVNSWGRGRIELVWQNLRDPQNPNRTTSL